MNLKRLICRDSLYQLAKTQQCLSRLQHSRCLACRSAKGSVSTLKCVSLNYLASAHALHQGSALSEKCNHVPFVQNRCFASTVPLKLSEAYHSKIETLADALASVYTQLVMHLSRLAPSIREVNHLFESIFNTKVPKGFERFFPEEQSDDQISKKKNDTEKEYDSNRNGDKESSKNDQRGPSPNSTLAFIAFLVFCGILSYLNDKNSFGHHRSNQIDIQFFLNQLLSKGLVHRVEIINKEIVRVILRPDCPKEMQPHNGNLYEFRIGSTESFESKVEAFQYSMGIHPSNFVTITHSQEMNFLSELVGYLPTIAIVSVSLLLIRKLASVGAANDPNKFLRMGRANPVSSKDVKVKVKFSDVAGMKEAKHEIKEFVDFLKDPTKYQQLGAHIPKGALLVGPPGTGKTLLAKAVAGEANVPFYSMSGSDFIEVFVGVGPSRVRDLFTQARKNSPSIIFIDEIDAVGRKRAKGGFAGGANDERENTLNQMLVEMDGFTTQTGVIVLAGTNRADILDPALTRPGRFDRTVNIEKPDLAERTEMFQIHMKPIKLDASLEPEATQKRLAALTPGFVGADISNVCNEAAIYAARRNAKGVHIQDFESACERVLGGMKKSTGFINEELRRTIAFHEAGHAVVGWFLKYGDPVLKVSIVPRTNGALGFAQNLPDEIQLLPKQQILDKIAVLLGGRVSEELNIGLISTGASDDLDKVTKLSYAFVSVWGFNPKVGLMSFQNREESNQFYKPYSEQLAQIIDTEVRSMIDDQYKRVKKLLQNKDELLKKLTERLLIQETITFNDLREVLGERPHPLKQEYASYVEASPTRQQIPSPIAATTTESLMQNHHDQNDNAGNNTLKEAADDIAKVEDSAATGFESSKLITSFNTSLAC